MVGFICHEFLKEFETSIILRRCDTIYPWGRMGSSLMTKALCRQPFLEKSTPKSKVEK